jgi:hypothetical protein
MSAAPPVGGAPPKKKTSPWIFVLIGCAGLIVVVGVAMVAIGFFAVNKAKEAGFDPSLLKENPALAAAKLAAAADEDIEVVGVDEDAGTITFREKSTGKEVTMNASDIREGKITFESDEGETATFEAGGAAEGEGFRVQTPEGSYQLGAPAGAALPGWLPAYPGTSPEGVMSSTTPEGRGGSATMKTGDSPAQVIAFYKKALEDAGMEVSTVDQAGRGGMVSGETADKSRGAMIIIGADGGGTTVNATYRIKD